MPNVKVLLTGAVEGDLAGTFKKIDAVNKKSGPFGVLFCVGQFFGGVGWGGVGGGWDAWGLLPTRGCWLLVGTHAPLAAACACGCP